MTSDDVIKLAASMGLDLEAQSDAVLIARLGEVGQDLSKLSKPCKLRLMELGYLSRPGTRRFKILERTEK
jgi:hypothetical protein